MNTPEDMTRQASSESRFSPEELIDYFKKRFGDKIKSAKIETKEAAVKKNKFSVVWLRINREIFRDAVKALMDIQFPHLSMVSGNDLGDEIELLYHFTINYGEHLKEIPVNICVSIPKTNPKIPSICDLIPGALITEREKQDMLGVEVENIPDSRRIFVPDDFPEGVYPWRKDEKGVPESMIKKLYEVR